MVPLRFISETLGARVVWDQVTKTVYVATGGYQLPLITPPVPADLKVYENKPVIDIRPMAKPMFEVLPFTKNIKGANNNIKCFLVSYDDLKKNAYKIDDNKIVYDFIPTAGVDEVQVLIGKSDTDMWTVFYANHKGEANTAVMCTSLKNMNNIAEYTTNWPTYFDTITLKQFKNGMTDVEYVFFTNKDENKGATYALIVNNPLYKG